MAIPSNLVSVDTQFSQHGDLHLEPVTIHVTPLDQRRQSLRQGCLETCLVSKKSDRNWVLKEKSQLFTATNAVRPKSMTNSTGLLILVQLAAQTRQDQLKHVVVRIHSQESDALGPTPEQVLEKDLIGPHLILAGLFEH
jgi:hypothetical protein